ncbi:MAG: hypothetical protein JW841_09770 [Deltaproteobacteria bacterium]|nr:hypothetical protein [Deltaproteobacteria bacterium]
MPGIHIRDLSELAIKALKRRAIAHRRSVQGEVRVILEEAARAAPPENGYEPIQLYYTEVGNEQVWTREDFYDDKSR